MSSTAFRLTVPVHRSLATRLLLILLMVGLLGVASRPCLMALEQLADAGAPALPQQPVHTGHGGHGGHMMMADEHPAPAQSPGCHDGNCTSLEARELTTPQRVLLEVLLKLPLPVLLLWLLPLILLWGPVRPPPPAPHLPWRPPPPLRFRVLLI